MSEHFYGVDETDEWEVLCEATPDTNGIYDIVLVVLDKSEAPAT